MKKKKNIAIFADGTWNRKDSGAKTNVGRLYEMAESRKLDDDPNTRVTEQRTFYDPGIGTGMLKLTGGIFGWGISTNIKECYRFLVAHYEPGDQIFLFGFSRGAYTVRSLAGMLSKVGILEQEHATETRVKIAYQVYRSHTEYPHRVDEFRRQFCRECPIHFIGVWDTVGALGIPLGWINRWNPFPHGFHDTDLGENVKYAYHALAIDEARAKFAPTLWTIPAKEKKKREKSGQKLKQVWFAGMHADVGGGYLESSLSDIPLEWMAKCAKDAGLVLNSKWTSHLSASHLGMMHNSRLGWKSLFGKRPRILEDAEQGLIHGSVLRRREDSEKWQTAYNPINLEDSALEPEDENWPNHPQQGS